MIAADPGTSFEGLISVMSSAREPKARVDAETLGIRLKAQREPELFKWLVACLLFGKPVQQEVAGGAFHELEQAHLMSPAAIRKAGWKRLVKVLDNAHYVRYDESTATRLLQAADTLNERFGGSVRNVVRDVRTRSELSKRLQEFKGLAPKPARSLFAIFGKLAGGPIQLMSDGERGVRQR
jgi:endonuclease III